MLSARIQWLIEIDREYQRMRLEMIRFMQAEGDGAEVGAISDLLDTMEALSSNLLGYATEVEGPLTDPSAKGGDQ